MPHLSISQSSSKIHWASTLEYQFNSFEERGDWSGAQVIGAPDAFPPGVLNEHAFRMQEEKMFGKLLVGFDEPIHAQQLVLVENNDPGRIVCVRITDLDGNNYIVYKNEPYDLNIDFRTLVVNFPRTKSPVKYVEISINSIGAPGNCQLDAVGLIDDNSVEAVEKQLAGANFNIQRELSYLDQKEPLSNKVNSPYPELKPVFSDDGKELFFTRVSNPQNANGYKDPQDIYRATKNGDDWEEAKNVGASLNNKYANGVCSYVNQNGLLVLNGHGNGKKGMGVSLVERKSEDSWSAPENLNIEFFYNLNKYQDYFLSSDKEAIVMALERNDTYGDLDLYVSIKQNGDFYTAPVNLGGKINTSANEFAPFLSADGRKLYFSSEGHRGFGNSDIYKCERLDDTWVNWSEPQNMGPAINSEDWEAYFTISPKGDYAYFVSNSGSENGDEDIYRIPLIQEVEPQEPEQFVVVKSEIFNEKDRSPVAADARLINKKTRKEYVPVDREQEGVYEMYPESGFTYTLNVSAKGYLPYQEEIDLQSGAVNDLVEKEIYLMPLEVGSTIVFENLLFEQGTAEMLESSADDLDRLSELLSDNESLVIELGGHTDRIGSTEALQELSEERVNVVKQYLVEHGANPEQITTVGYGGSQPIAPNDTEENRAKNRRVEVKVLEF